MFQSGMKRNDRNNDAHDNVLDARKRRECANPRLNGNDNTETPHNVMKTSKNILVPTQSRDSASKFALFCHCIPMAEPSEGEKSGNQQQKGTREGGEGGDRTSALREHTITPHLHTKDTRKQKHIQLSHVFSRPGRRLRCGRMVQCLRVKRRRM